MTAEEYGKIGRNGHILRNYSMPMIKHFAGYKTTLYGAIDICCRSVFGSILIESSNGGPVQERVSSTWIICTHTIICSTCYCPTAICAKKTGGIRYTNRILLEIWTCNSQRSERMSRRILRKAKHDYSKVFPCQGTSEGH
jgi:hypothetical protein